MHEFVAHGVDAILNETRRAGRRSKCLEVKKLYPRLAANGARVATREAREGQKLHILPFFSKSLVVVSVVPLANLDADGVCELPSR